MQKRLRSFTFAITASLGLALILPCAPVQASEVVKLARLVITGKRLSAERLEPLAAQKSMVPLAKTASPRLHAQTEAEPSTPAPASAGQDAPLRATAVHSRGVLSFL